MPVAVSPSLTALPDVAYGAEECRVSSFDGQQGSYRLASVVHGPRAYLWEGPSSCNPGGPACGGRFYVVPSDTEITGFAVGHYVYAFFGSKTGAYAGFLSHSEIALMPLVEAIPQSA